MTVLIGLLPARRDFGITKKAAQNFSHRKTEEQQKYLPDFYGAAAAREVLEEGRKGQPEIPQLCRSSVWRADCVTAWNVGGCFYDVVAGLDLGYFDAVVECECIGNDFFNR